MTAWAERMLCPLPSRRTHSEDSVSTPEEYTLGGAQTRACLHKQYTKLVCTCPGTGATHLIGRNGLAPGKATRRPHLRVPRYSGIIEFIDNRGVQFIFYVCVSAGFVHEIFAFSLSLGCRLFSFLSLHG